MSHFLFVLNTLLKPRSISQLIVDFIAIGERFFNSVCMHLQWRVYVPYTVRRSSPIVFKEGWTFSESISVIDFKRKNVHIHEDFVEIFSLEMSDSEADERYPVYAGRSGASSASVNRSVRIGHGHTRLHPCSTFVMNWELF